MLLGKREANNDEQMGKDYAQRRSKGKDKHKGIIERI
jgi:hypothetical protein